MTGRELRQYVRTGLQNRLVHLVGMYTRNDAPPKVRQDIEDTLALMHFVCRVADNDEDYSGLHNVPIGRTDTVIKMAMDRVADASSKRQIRDAMIYAIGQNVPRTEPEIMEQIRREGMMPMGQPREGTSVGGFTAPHSGHKPQSPREPAPSGDYPLVGRDG